MRSCLAALSAALFFACTCFADPRPKVRYDPLVLSGDPAPGFVDGKFSEFPYHSFVSDSNHTVFLGAVDAPYPGSWPNGIFVNHKGKNDLVAKIGQDAPGFAEGVKFYGFDINYHRANRSGQVVFEAYLEGPGILGTGDDDTNAHGNWFYSDGQLTHVAQWQSPAAGVPGAVWRTLSRTTVNDLGHVAFSGDMTGGGVNPLNNSAFWYGEPGALQVLAREGAPLPGRPGLSYGEISGFDYPVPAGNGVVGFSTGVRGVSGFSPSAIVTGEPGDLKVVIASGDPAPFTNSTVSTVQTHTPVDVNNRGEATFTAILGNGERGLYAGKAGDLRLLALTGQPADHVPGKTFDFFFGADINDKGEVAFRADVKPTDDSHDAIYLAKQNGNLELIAMRDQHAPGTDAGVNFGWFFSDPVINKDGQVAFFATLDGPNSRGEKDYGIFATGHNGELRLIARYGDQFELSPGDVRTIEALSHAGVYGTHVLTFNEDSNLSFMMRFEDGSEALVTATVLPEPGAMVLIGLAAMLLRRCA